MAEGADQKKLDVYKKWAFALVPALALMELVAHLWQTTGGVVPDADWKAAREIVKSKAQADDLVLFAPKWTDPLGREFFKDDVASIAREAFPDATGFPRAIEVSIRGKHRPEIDGWREVARESAGKITITTYENPAPVKVLDRLVSRVLSRDVKVQRVDGAREVDCTFGQGAAQTGGLGFGPAVPAARWSCPVGGFVGVTVLPALDYSARQCIYAPPQGGASVMRIVFPNVHFGGRLHGHHGLYAEAERNKTGAPVTLAFRVGEASLGRVVHRDGDGWKGFELDTGDFQGKSADLVAEVSAPSGNRRQYCFEADTR